MDIYKNPKLYDAIHRQYKADEAFIFDWAAKIGGPVLELAAGTGRLGLPLVKFGLNYIGLELNHEFVTFGNEKLAPYPNGNIVQGDMQNFSFYKKFQFIFIGFNSFLHNYTNVEAASCLKNVKKHLKPGGRFIVSIFIPDPSFLYRKKDKLYKVLDHFEFEGQNCSIWETNRFDEDQEINHLIWYLFRDGKKDPNPYLFKLRMFYPDTIDRLISEAGLTIYEKLGDYKNNPLSEESDLQIYLCGLKD